MLKSEVVDNGLSKAVIARGTEAETLIFFVPGAGLGYFGLFLPPPSVLGSKPRSTK